MEGVPRMLEEIKEQFNSQKKDFLDMKEQMNAINKNIDEKFLVVLEKYNELEEKINNQQQHINYLEKYIRRKNLIFFGIEEKEKTYQDLEENIINIINSKMNLNFDKNCIEYIGRMGKNKNKLRPVIVVLSSVGRKIELLKKKKCLKETNYYIMEDFPKDVLEKRKELRKSLEEERKQGRNAILKYDKIVFLKNQKELLSKNSVYEMNMASTLETNNNQNIQKYNKNNKMLSRKQHKNQKQK